MEINIKQIQTLLNSTKILLENQQEVKMLKGESFNIFSILDVENLETTTHTPFLRELLNPKGSHLMGDVFLKLFIQMLVNKGIANVEKHLTTENVVVRQKDKYLGPRNDETQEGGYLDIYIEDKQGKTISIENKIGAVDQNCQLVRYYKHNTENGILFYLTKFGKDASDESIIVSNKIGNLKNIEKLDAGKHYHLLSYKKDIITWLQNCLKEASEQPILRESIKQYLILIKKITNTMDKIEEKKLKYLIINNREEAKVIANNYADIVNGLREDFRQKIISELKKNGFKAKSIKHINQEYSRIEINIEGKKENNYFSIEPFNKNYILINAKINHRWIEDSDDNDLYFKVDNKNIDLQQTALLKKLNDEKYLNDLAESVADQAKIYIKENKALI